MHSRATYISYWKYDEKQEWLCEHSWDEPHQKLSHLLQQWHSNGILIQINNHTFNEIEILYVAFE